jgi:hypothetical protein
MPSICPIGSIDFESYQKLKTQAIFTGQTTSMNRRKAIFRLLVLGGGAAGVFGGVKAYHLLKEPELERLSQFQPLIDELAETIIPKTDTPGAKEAGVGKFITRMIKNCTGRKSQNNFIEGLVELVLYTGSRYDKQFEHCNAEQKKAVLAHFEKKGRSRGGKLGKAERYILGDSFFETLKKYTVLGYCTSKQGAMQALSYDYIPGKYIGCMPLTPDQRAWATQ